MFRLNVSNLIIRISSSKIYQKPTYIGSDCHYQISDKVVLKMNKRLYSGMVKSVFDSLNDDKLSNNVSINSDIDTIISQAETINDILNIPKIIVLKKSGAFKIISLLNSWVTQNKISFEDFSNDSRFLKICSLFNESIRKVPGDKFNYKSDLVTVLNYSGDDEAAKLISNVSLPQMIKIMQALANTQKRSITLLQSLAFNICLTKEKLTLKQCSDILFCMAKLNYQNEILAQRIHNDLCDTNLKIVDKTAIFGSILKSLGCLRYFDMDLIDLLSESILRNIDQCRSQELTSLIMTLANFNYLPSNSELLMSKMLPKLSLFEMNSKQAWIEVVWSLIVLEYASKEMIESVLNPHFLQRINSDEMSSTLKLKLLNINAAAKLMKNYEGPYLDIKKIKVDIGYSKEKLMFCDLVTDSLMNILPAQEFLKTNVTTDMGFRIDAECMFDAKSNPIKFLKNKGKNNTKVAFLIAYYHDVCSNDTSRVLGFKILAKRFLEEMNYKVLIISYSNFNFNSKLSDRVTYIDTKLKECIK